MVYLDMTEAGAWLNIVKGNFIILNDAQAIEEDMEKNGEIDGITYAVTDKKTFIEQNELCVVHFLTIVSQVDEQECVLAVKIVGDDFTATVFFDAPEIPKGMTRAELFDSGFDILWEDEDAEIVDLPYVEFITAPLENDTGEVCDVKFVQKGCPLFGEMVESYGEPTFTTFVEYLAEEEFFNPELLILEEGDCEEEGGVVTVLLGAQIGSGDIQVY